MIIMDSLPSILRGLRIINLESSSWSSLGCLLLLVGGHKKVDIFVGKSQSKNFLHRIIVVTFDLRALNHNEILSIIFL